MERTSFLCGDIVNALQARMDREIELMQEALGNGDMVQYKIHQEKAGAFLGSIRIVEKRFKERNEKVIEAITD